MEKKTIIILFILTLLILSLATNITISYITPDTSKLNTPINPFDGGDELDDDVYPATIPVLKTIKNS